MALRPCTRCQGLASELKRGLCPKCQSELSSEINYKDRRGTPSERGYDRRWRNLIAKLEREFGLENQLCYLHLPGCEIFSVEWDHISPPADKTDPLFYNFRNLAKSCRSCNRLKGNRSLAYLEEKYKIKIKLRSYNKFERN